MSPRQSIFSRMIYTEANNKDFIELNLIHFKPKRERRRLPSSFSF